MLPFGSFLVIFGNLSEQKENSLVIKVIKMYSQEYYMKSFKFSV